MDAVHGISVALLRPLAELLGRLDVDSAGFLAALGVEEAMPPNTYIAAATVDDQLAAIAARRADPAFALTLARTSLVRPLGLFGHMVWLSGTVRDAVTRAAKFYAMVTRRTTLTLDESAGELATLRMQPVTRGVTRGRILTEFPFASLALRAREATGGAFALRAVRFTHAGEPTPAYAEVFGAPVTFAARHDELELATSQLDLRLASADPITSAALEAKVAQLTAGGSGHSAFVARVRSAIATHLEAELTPTAIARALGISARTLRRHLEQEGVSLRATLDEVRRERADELLAAGTPIKEIAFALGFSEPSAFSRAYKRWTGVAPRKGS
ncbi:MAG: AraC family transcriptional regulator ligand-binding domain-containing protein [Myxococcales bacterium]|nr:AraC family transcriptional regulator ligand-binding domain-containing protein [Myxococcales bacterium]